MADALAGGVSVEDVKRQLSLMGYEDVPDSVVLEFLEEIKAEEPSAAAAEARTPPRRTPALGQRHGAVGAERPDEHSATAGGNGALPLPLPGREPDFVTPPHTPIRGWSATNSPTARMDCHADDGPVMASLLQQDGESPWSNVGQSSDEDGFHSSREGEPGEVTPKKSAQLKEGVISLSPPIDVEPSPPAATTKTQHKTPLRSSALLRQPPQRIPKAEAAVPPAENSKVQPRHGASDGGSNAVRPDHQSHKGQIIAETRPA
eukprot:SAG31_NODE_8058_length_1531_cov_1.334497_1_plen_260_part_10